jgi:predicted ATPase
MASADSASVRTLTFISLELSNFLSYKRARIDFGDFVALVGTNSSGKSNAVSAIKLLREISYHGLPTAIAKRGGFDQLRHRSAGHPYNPGIRLRFKFGNAETSTYEIFFNAIKGKKYEVKRESATVFVDNDSYSFTRRGEDFSWTDRESDRLFDSSTFDRDFKIPPDQSVISQSGLSLAGRYVASVLQATQHLEINPSVVGDLQDPSSTREFGPNGSNLASIIESFDTRRRQILADQLSAIVPGIDRIGVQYLADKLTIYFYQKVAGHDREFQAKQMSDGTLRCLGILAAMLQEPSPALLVIEEPETAIHLGALDTLVDVLRQQAESAQVVITTHSADIVDKLDLDDIRVVWSDKGESHISEVAEHSREPVRLRLITPGALLRADALDAAV